MQLLQLLVTAGNSWQTIAIFAAFADLVITADLATFATRVALASLVARATRVARATLATLVACAALATLVASANVASCCLYSPCVRLVKHRQQPCIKLQQKYEMNKQRIQS